VLLRLARTRTPTDFRMDELLQRLIVKEKQWVVSGVVAKGGYPKQTRYNNFSRNSSKLVQETPLNGVV
jgi:hypothetical protein